jgi:hypothetical protein
MISASRTATFVILSFTILSIYKKRSHHPFDGDTKSHTLAHVDRLIRTLPPSLPRPEHLRTNILSRCTKRNGYLNARAFDRHCEILLVGFRLIANEFSQAFRWP